MRPSRVASRSAGAALAAVVIVGLVAVIGSYTFLPPMIEDLLARDVRDQLGLQRKPEVELTSEPAPRMLAGEFSSGRVVLEEPVFAGIRPQRVTVNLDPVEVDVLKSARNGQFVTSTPVSGDVRVEVPESEVRRLVEAGAADVPITEMSLEEGRVRVASRVEALGVEVPVGIEGNLRLREGRLVFDPRRISALGLKVPGGLSKESLSGSRFGYPLEELPYGSGITGVRVEEGRVVLSGRIERLVGA